jgi:hypothetical protein
MNNFERLMSALSGIHDNYSEEIEWLIKSFKVGGLFDKRDKAADAGTLAHSFAENYMKGLPEPKTDGLPKDVVDKAEGCYLTFLDLAKTNIKKVINSEVELTSEEYPFGGTIDYLIETPMTPANMVDILDLKTGKDIYFEAKIQVKSYGKLWNEHHPELPVAGFHIWRLGENGEFTHKYFPSLDEGYWQIFLHCLEINQTLDRLGEKL